MEKRLLQKSDFQKLHRTFCLAFSDYKVNFNPTQEEFDVRIHKKLNVDYQLSGGVFDGEEMVGFILHASNIYEGIPTAFNGGTGVIPGFRNQKAGEELYEFLIPHLMSKAVARVILEVIDSNEKAIRLYEKIGFTFRRGFACFRLNTPFDYPTSMEVKRGTMDDINKGYTDFEPSFIDSFEQLKAGGDHERVLVLKDGEKMKGFLIFQPAIGRISQLAVGRLYRGEGIGRALIAEAQRQSSKNLTIMNIPEDELEFQQFLVSCGFENQVNQFEMELIL